MMSSPNRLSHIQKIITGEYGMIIVLIALVVLFSVLTIERRPPSDSAKAGSALAAKIAKNHPDARVFVATNSTDADGSFASALEAGLSEEGIEIAGSARGTPADIRAKLESTESVTVIAPSPAIETQPVFDSFVKGGLKLVTTPKRPWPDFLRLNNLRNIASQIAVIAIIAIGMTLVIITAGIDLSVGSLIALSSVVCTLVIGYFGGAGTESVEPANNTQMVLAVIIAITACALVGAFTGWMVAGFCVPPFIATLAMMQVVRGTSFEIADNQTIHDVPASFQWLGNGLTFNVPNCVILMIVLYVIAHIVMTKTRFGRHVYATGGNPEAARLSGVSPKRIKLIVYIVSAALAGIGGVVLASQLQSGAGKNGTGYELDVIAAVVVGGTSLFGGRGKIFGTLIGAFIIAVINNGMNLKKLGSEKQMYVLGAVILTAVLVERVRSGEWKSSVGG